MIALSSPSAAHHLPWAKGRSTETVKTTVSSKSDKVLLKWRVCIEQIPVSMDGMMLRTFFLPAKSAKDFFSRAGVINEKSWAISPTWSWDPVKVTGFPKNVAIKRLLFCFYCTAIPVEGPLICLEIWMVYWLNPSAILSKFHFIML